MTERNAPCPCGSGRKFKHCCLKNNVATPPLAQAESLYLEALSHYHRQNLLATRDVANLAVNLHPQHAHALNLLGLVSMHTGHTKEALPYFTRAVGALPSSVEFRCNLAVAQIALEQLEAAEQSLQEALKITPNADLYNNIGGLQVRRNDFDGAVASYRSAIRLNSTSAVLWNNLGYALCNQAPNENTLQEAADAYTKAIALDPKNVDALLNQANLRLRQGDADAALKTYRQVLAVNEHHAAAHNNLANLLQDKGQFEAAAESMRRSREAKVDYWHPDVASSWLFGLSMAEGIDPAYLFNEHVRFAQTFEAPLRNKWPKHENSRISDKTLRVGIVSPDFRNHSLANFVEPLIAELKNKKGLALFAYYNHPIEDARSKKIKCHFNEWRPISKLSDSQVFETIRSDGIDILIDLGGHTALHRLLVFARKPAPVQISFMGYPGTTGLQAMDYYAADRYFLPMGSFDEQFTEKIVRLPAGAPFLPLESAPEVGSLPALTNGHITFGSFNRPIKISRNVIALWAKLLLAVPNARMLLGAMESEGIDQRISNWFVEEGINVDRLTFCANCPMDQYMRLHHQVDICLDTFPYNGGTTSWHAIWMGVPTLTIASHTPASRSGASIMGHMGLDTFVANSNEEFVTLGVSHAVDLTKLAAIRASMRARFASTPVGQPAAVATGFEKALRLMWQRWCDGLAPVAFEVEPQPKLPNS